jgi:transcription elongation factor Elf1
MVIFAECPQCKEKITLNAKHDVKMVVNKNKTKMVMDCKQCKAEFEIIIKLKIRKPKSILDIIDPE